MFGWSCVSYLLMTSQHTLLVVLLSLLRESCSCSQILVETSPGKNTCESENMRRNSAQAGWTWNSPSRFFKEGEMCVFSCISHHCPKGAILLLSESQYYELTLNIAVCYIWFICVVFSWTLNGIVCKGNENLFFFFLHFVKYFFLNHPHSFKVGFSQLLFWLLINWLGLITFWLMVKAYEIWEYPKTNNIIIVTFDKQEPAVVFLEISLLMNMDYKLVNSFQWIK